MRGRGLFQDLPRNIKPRRVMMQYSDGGGESGYDVEYTCKKCGHEEWFHYESEPSRSYVYRGEPCPKCNLIII